MLIYSNFITLNNNTCKLSSSGLTNLEEYTNETDSNDDDTDSDGMPNGWEVDNSLDPLTNDAVEDADGDRFTNLEEYLVGTDPILLILV